MNIDSEARVKRRGIFQCNINSLFKDPVAFRVSECHENKMSTLNRQNDTIRSINSDPIMQHSEVDQTKSTTPFGLSDFKSIPFRVCNAPYKLDACTSHSQIISVGYYLTLPLSQVVGEAFIMLIR